MTAGQAGKGDAKRLSQIGKEEEALRWALKEGKITFEEFELSFNKLLRAGKIVRGGRVLSPKTFRRHNK